MALIAAELRMLSRQRPWVIELFSCRHLCRFEHPRLLADDRMTELAILAEHLSFPADVISIVAAKTAGKYSMADVIGMGAPVDLHLGEDIGPINPLHLRDGLLDCFPLRWIYLWILFHIKPIEGCRDTFSSLFPARIILAQRADCLSLDIG